MIYTIEEIRRIVTPIAQKYHVAGIYLFGSYARGTANEDSDLDFLVDTTGMQITGFLEFASLHIDLEEAFQKKVDLITMRSILQQPKMPSEESFKKTVMEERVRLYEVA